MGERLRIVSQLISSIGVELLREEPERSREVNERLETLTGLIYPAQITEIFNHPERAGQERALFPFESIVGGRERHLGRLRRCGDILRHNRTVPEDEPILAGKVALGRIHRTGYSRVRP